LAEGDFFARKKRLSTVGEQYPTAALILVEYLSCAKQVTTFLSLHGINIDDSFDPASSGP
jgi:hypothetical protein